MCTLDWRMGNFDRRNCSNGCRSGSCPYGGRESIFSGLFFLYFDVRGHDIALNFSFAFVSASRSCRPVTCVREDY